MIQLNNIALSFGDNILFQDVNLNLVSDECYGITGSNGSGKSTLLKLIMGNFPASQGNIQIAKSLKLGWLAQDQFENDQMLIHDVVLKGNKELWQGLKKKEKLLEKSVLDDEQGNALALIEQDIYHHGGYVAEGTISNLLCGLGIPISQHKNKLSTLSGGYKLRVLLAQCLFSQPDILLLDEPTNHLDILSISWLEKYLQSYPGLCLVISHDQMFLNNIVTSILDIDYQTIKSYKGNYDAFINMKNLEVSQKEREISLQEKNKMHMQKFVDRFSAKASKARQANSMKKIIQKLPKINIVKSSRRAPNFQFNIKKNTGRQVLETKNLGIYFQENKYLFENLNFTLNRGDRVAIVGENGVGKTTLLNILNAALPSSSGTFDWGMATNRSMIAQNQKEVLNEKISVLKFLAKQVDGIEDSAIRKVLGMMLFKKEDVNKKCSQLSGGEATRVLFAKVMLEQPNVLLLDEPTNHLDIETIQALTASLKQYEGTLLLVSHNRQFVSALATHILSISKGAIHFHHGGIQAYIEKEHSDYLSLSTLKKKAEKKKTPLKKDKKLKQSIFQLDKEIKKMERMISNKEEKIIDIDQRIEAFYLSTQPKDSIETLIKEKKNLQTQIESIFQQWTDESKKLERLQVTQQEMSHDS